MPRPAVRALTASEFSVHSPVFQRRAPARPVTLASLGVGRRQHRPNVPESPPLGGIYDHAAPRIGRAERRDCAQPGSPVGNGGSEPEVWPAVRPGGASHSCVCGSMTRVRTVIGAAGGIGGDAAAAAPLASGITALGRSLRAAVLDWAAAVPVHAGLGLAPGPDAGSHRPLNRVHGVIDRVHRTPGLLHNLGSHRPLHRTPGMNRAAYTTRNQQPGKEPHRHPHALNQPLKRYARQKDDRRAIHHQVRVRRMTPAGASIRRSLSPSRACRPGCFLSRTRRFRRLRPAHWRLQQHGKSALSAADPGVAVAAHDG